MSRVVVLLTVATAFFATGLLWQRVWGFYPLQANSWAWVWNYTRAYGHLPWFLERSMFGVGGGIIVLILVIQAVASRIGVHTVVGGRGKDELHGSARWARKAEAKAARLFGRTGVVVGGWRRSFRRARMLRHDGPEHVLVFAPTGSGKGVSLILPTLLTWMESVFILDIKKENFSLSSGWRASLGHRILMFEPTAETGSIRFNPLAEVRIGSGREIADCQNIAAMIIDSDGKGLQDYWRKEGWTWLSVLLLHILYRVQRDDGRVANFEDVNTFVSGIVAAGTGEDNFAALLDDMIAFEHGSEHVDKEIRRGANRMLIKAPQERSGVHSSAITELALYADPIVARNTAVSDFQLADLVQGDRPAAFYFVIPPSDMDRLRPLIRIILNVMLRRFTEEMEFKDGRSVSTFDHRLLLMLDEFTSVGKLEIVERALAFMRGYGLKAYIVIQGISQLHQAYGREESIMPNCGVRLAFTPNTIETAKVLSEMTGKATIVQQSRSRSRKVGEIGSVTDSIQGTGRPLLTPDECMRLPLIREVTRWGRKKMIPGETLTFVGGVPPIRGRQALYFQDKELRRRAAMPAPAMVVDDREEGGNP